MNETSSITRLETPDSQSRFRARLAAPVGGDWNLSIGGRGSTHRQRLNAELESMDAARGYILTAGINGNRVASKDLFASTPHQLPCGVNVYEPTGGNADAFWLGVREAFITTVKDRPLWLVRGKGLCLAGRYNHSSVGLILAAFKDLVEPEDLSVDCFFGAPKEHRDYFQPFRGTLMRAGVSSSHVHLHKRIPEKGPFVYDLCGPSNLAILVRRS